MLGTPSRRAEWGDFVAQGEMRVVSVVEWFASKGLERSVDL